MCLVTDPSSYGSWSANGNEIHFAYEGRSINMLPKYTSALGSRVAKPQKQMHEANNTLHNHCDKVSWDNPNSRPPFLGCHKIKRTCMAFQFTKEIRRITKSHQWVSGRRSSWNRRSDYQGRWVLLKIDDCNQGHLFRYNKNQMQWLWFTVTTYSIISHCIFWHCSFKCFYSLKFHICIYNVS